MQPGQVINLNSELRSIAQPRDAGVRLFRELVFYGALIVCFVVSFAFATKPDLKAFFPAYWVLLECAYFYYGCHPLKYSRKSLNFAFKGQLKFFLKIFSHVAALTATTALIDYMVGNPILPDKNREGRPVLETLTLQTLNFIRVALCLSAIVALAQIRSLRRNGFSFTELADGDYKRLSITIPAQAKVVESELALRLQKLRFTKAPRFNRMFFETVPRVREGRAGLTQSVELTWPFCPTKVCIALSSVDSGTEVRLECSLRGGLYAFEVFPAPKEVMALLNFLRANLVDAVKSEICIANALRKQDEFRHLAVEAQLRMLQTQIEPHFLFNTLANVQELYRENVVAGEDMLNHLTAYFRGAVDGFRSDNSTIGKELDLSYRYLAIMSARMGDRLKIVPAVSAGLEGHPIPPAMLISLVENAIKHGIAPKMQGTISISAVRAGEVVRLEVADDGAGFSSVGGTGVGLSNLRQRLLALYGAAAWLEIEAVSGGGFKASIVLPFEREIENA